MIVFNTPGPMKLTAATFDATPFKLQISSKKLLSGKCQVKFYAQGHIPGGVYGYVLVDPKSTLKEVVDGIHGKLHNIRNKEYYHHNHLYSMKKIKQNNSDFIIFGP